MSATTACETYASFEDHWSPDEYLADYYTDVQPDEEVTMRFLVEAAALVGDTPRLLEFGCGPTVHHLLPFVPRAAEIHVVDYLERNLDAVRRWVDGRDGAWEWTPFTRFTLSHELGRPPGDREVHEREATARERVVSLGRADARRSQPLASGPRRFPVVLCCFCPDSITADLEEWRRCTSHVASLVAPGGWFVLTALGGADSYRVAHRRYPSPDVSVDDVADVLQAAGFCRLGTTVTSTSTSDADDHGFDRVILAVARKP